MFAGVPSLVHPSTEEGQSQSSAGPALPHHALHSFLVLLTALTLSTDVPGQSHLPACPPTQALLGHQEGQGTEVEPSLGWETLEASARGFTKGEDLLQREAGRACAYAPTWAMDT